MCITCQMVMSPVEENQAGKKEWKICRKNQFYPHQGGVYGEREICARSEEGERMSPVNTGGRIPRLRIHCVERIWSETRPSELKELKEASEQAWGKEGISNRHVTLKIIMIPTVTERQTQF